MNKKRNKNKKAKKFVKFLVTLLLLCAAVISFCLFTPFFNLKEVSVVGTENLSHQEVVQVGQLPFGENIFKISKKDVCEKISRLPEVETVNMTRIPFSKIKITIKETHAVYAFKTTSGYVYTDRTGKIMKILDEFDESELPVVLGIEGELPKISEKMTVQDGVKFDIILDNLSILLDKGITDELSEIDFSDLSSLVGRLKSGAKVIFGRLDDLDYKLSVLLAILPQVDANEDTYIDLTTPSNAFYGRLEDRIAKSDAEDPSSVSDAEKTDEIVGS